MGVDIQTYRCRIGTYKSLQGLDVKTLTCCVNYSRGLKIVGSVAFIGILLLIAGVESNPGPLITAKCTCSAHQTKIKVSGLPTNIDEEDLKNLFENENRQGGGSVKEITFFPDKAAAIVEFEEKEAVEKVLKKRPIHIKKKTVDVEQCHTPYTLKLKGPHLTLTSVDVLAKWLEKSYGEVACITFLSEDSGTTFVTFRDEKVCHSPEKKIHDDGKFTEYDEECIGPDVDSTACIDNGRILCHLAPAECSHLDHLFVDSKKVFVFVTNMATLRRKESHGRTSWHGLAGANILKPTVDIS